jgi:hypothetical protein
MGLNGFNYLAGNEIQFSQIGCRVGTFFKVFDLLQIMGIGRTRTSRNGMNAFESWIHVQRGSQRQPRQPSRTCPRESFLLP